MTFVPRKWEGRLPWCYHTASSDVPNSTESELWLHKSPFQIYYHNLSAHVAEWPSS